MARVLSKQQPFCRGKLQEFSELQLQQRSLAKPIQTTIAKARQVFWTLNLFFASICFQSNLIAFRYSIAQTETIFQFLISFWSPIFQITCLAKFFSNLSRFQTTHFPGQQITLTNLIGFSFFIDVIQIFEPQFPSFALFAIINVFTPFIFLFIFSLPSILISFSS